jgi:myo-inositol-1(or 4)-monophosphatase
MTDTQLERALAIVRNAVTTASLELKQHFGNVAFSNHGSNAVSVFTELDRKTEQYLAKELGKFSPDIGFTGEEFGTQSKGSATWLVDPIDGTSHFIRGLPFCQVMVALVENGKVVLSVIHNIAQNDTYWAIRGKGAFCNETRIAVSTRSLKESIVAFETRLKDPENYKTYLELSKTANTINFLTSGFEFCMIACGKLDGKIGLKPYGQDWDFAPGSLLVTEAGGVATNIGSTGYDYTNHDFIISNAQVHDELTKGNNAVFPVVE